MRLLVTGAGGMLGRDVRAAATRAGHEVLALTRSELDITDAEACRRVLTAERPDAIVNCAAWTDVDGAEAHEDEATLINGTAVGHLAGFGHLVHVSSDYVFDGRASEPYPEDAPTAPLGAYGRSKLAGERAVAGREDVAVVRSSWLFGAGGKNFVDTMLRVGADRDEVTVVDDQVGCPTYTGHLAPALVEVAERRLSGILHVAGGGSCSWWDLAAAAYERAGLRTTIHRGRTADLGRPAPRPAYSVFGITRPETPRLPGWQAGLDAYLNERTTQ